MSAIVETRLRREYADGRLSEDGQQLRAAAALDAVLARLGARPSGFFARLTGRDTAPLGLYMWGGVGRGKSMLMDWFFEAAQTPAKQRVHFHAFMIDVHARIGEERKTGKGDPIAPVAKDIAKAARLLCTDEFHVTDIADAMILSRLFSALWEAGVVVVATSNRAPDDLYPNGLNRPLFEPFIEIMPDHMIIHEFAGEVDHRLRQLTAAPVYYTPLGPKTDAAMDAAWDRLTGQAEAKVTELSVQGRPLILRRTAAGTARASFTRLCSQALGPADYLRLSKAFQTVMIDNVPQMGPELRNEAKRFVTLIDALYETRTKLIMSAAVQPEDLYKDGTGAFEFERTASRLMEMRSEDYLGARRVMGDEGVK